MNTLFGYLISFLDWLFNTKFGRVCGIVFFLLQVVLQLLDEDYLIAAFCFGALACLVVADTQTE